MLKRKIKIENLILKNYNPEFFSVLDVSEQHRGHQNFKEDIESHFEIIIVSEKLDEYVFKNIYLSKTDRIKFLIDNLKRRFIKKI